MTPSASARPTSCSTAAPRPSASSNLGLAYLRSPEPRGRGRPGTRPTDLSRWERYTQALLAANEFLFVD